MRGDLVQSKRGSAGRHVCIPKGHLLLHCPAVSRYSIRPLAIMAILARSNSECQFVLGAILFVSVTGLRLSVTEYVLRRPDRGWTTELLDIFVGKQSGTHICTQQLLYIRYIHQPRCFRFWVSASC